MMAEEKKGMGCFAKGCITLVVIGLLLGVIGGVVGYMGYNYAKGFVATSPIPIPVKQATPEQFTAIRGNFEAFQQAIQNGAEAEWELTADDINIAIAMDPEWAKVKGKAQVLIKDGQLLAQASIPLEKLDPKNPQFAGKYLNGTIGIVASIENGEFLLAPRTIEVNGKQVPDWIIKNFFSGPEYEKSFRESFKKDMKPETAQLLAKIKSLKIEKDRLVVKSTGTGPPIILKSQPVSSPAGSAPPPTESAPAVPDSPPAPSEPATPPASDAPATPVPSDQPAPTETAPAPATP